MHTPCRNSKRPGRTQALAGIQGVLVAVFVALPGFLHPARLMSQDLVPVDREELLKGQGMGLAIVADRNHYPGPKHVLELKAELGLTRDQVRKAEALDKVVSISAAAKGEEIVQAEQALDTMFATGGVNEKFLRVKLEEIGKLRADFRFIHLQAHLRMRQILTPEQVKHYDELRPRENKQEN